MMKRLALILALLAAPTYAEPMLYSGPLLLPKAALHSPLYDIIGTAKIVVGGGTGTGAIAGTGDTVLSLSTQGFLVRTGTNTYITRSVAADTGVTVTNTDGVSGNVTVGIDTAVVPLYSTGSSDPSANCTAGTTIFTQTTTHAPWWCSDTNTWSKFLAGNTPTVGKASTATGSLGFIGTTSGSQVTMTVGASTGAWTMTLPTSAGTNLYVLQTDGSGATSWVAQSGGGGWTMSAAKVFADSPVTVSTSSIMYPCNAVGGATLFNLPTASSHGNLIILVKKTDSSSNKCSIVPSGADTIDGVNAAYDIITQYSTVMVQSDGTSAWYIE